jgi:flagellar export protein FliJ
MKREGLSVVLRLARLEERRALHQLGAARVRSAALEDRLARLAADGAEALESMALAPGSALPAGILQQHCARLEGSRHQAARVGSELRTAHDAEESARAALAGRRLRVRVVSNAIERRAARARLSARRGEARRIDEAVRGVRSQGEAGDAPA